MKMMSEFREGMWAVVQQAISTLDTDFVGVRPRAAGQLRTAGGAARSSTSGWPTPRSRPTERSADPGAHAGDAVAR